ncbi:hypothetical protein CP533_0591 [Ophiocordyceps camponoti-saundersi (nom. inval.)]|nr:hypothetical protein CP533_0591 [Ophiocordyceps camponoti-saundersi (nom. inval.)]
MQLINPLTTLTILLPTLVKGDCYHRSGLCRWYGGSPQCKPLVAGKRAGKPGIYLRPGHKFKDPEDGRWYEIVTWTRNMSIHQLYRLDHDHPLYPGEQCYHDYGVGCWQGWKTLGCR